MLSRRSHHRNNSRSQMNDSSKQLNDINIESKYNDREETPSSALTYENDASINSNLFDSDDDDDQILELRMKVPQVAPETCRSKDYPEYKNTVNISSSRCPSLSLSTLPFDVLVIVFGFLPIEDVDGGVKMTCNTLRHASGSHPVWRDACLRTGKINAVTPCDPMNEQQQGGIKIVPFNPFRHHYYSNPCVPYDFPTIQTALAYTGTGSTVTLLPGIYNERIVCYNKTNITIRAAFPEIGAALVHYSRTPSGDDENNDGYYFKDEPCILFSGHNTSACISNIQILHSSLGSNIWGGNCAIHVDDKAQLTIDSCALQSDSGRGTVVTGGSKLFVSKSTIHDCAATGLYVGDMGTFATVVESNIIRNGGGSRRWAIESDDINNESEDDEEFWDNDTANADIVPPGHSGMYVETGQAIVHDCMLAGNSLTGLSVVRGGGVRLSGCDLTENGAEPITVEDHQGIVALGDHPNGGVSTRGVVALGPDDNNFTNRNDSASTDSTEANDDFRKKMITNKNNRAKNNNEFWLALGGRVRNTPYPCSMFREMTQKRLRRRHIGARVTHEINDITMTED